MVDYHQVGTNFDRLIEQIKTMGEFNYKEWVMGKYFPSLVDIGVFEIAYKDDVANLWEKRNKARENWEQERVTAEKEKEERHQKRLMEKRERLEKELEKFLGDGEYELQFEDFIEILIMRGVEVHPRTYVS